MADLQEALQHLLKASRISGNKNSYRKDNPAEYGLVVAYINGGSRPNVTTEMGLGLREVEDVLRTSVPPPDPPLPPNVARSAPTGSVS